MIDESPHACLDSGGAHHFYPDVNGVPICSCGEVQLTLEEHLILIEFESQPILPPDEVEALIEQVAWLLGITVDEFTNRAKEALHGHSSSPDQR